MFHPSTGRGGERPAAAQEQVTQLGPRIAAEAGKIPAPCEGPGPDDLAALSPQASEV